MRSYTSALILAIALIACANANGSYNDNNGGDSYAAPAPAPSYAPSNTYAIPSYKPPQPPKITSSVTYSQNKGDLLIHRPRTIYVQPPSTRLLVNHPPIIVKPNPVIFHKPPAVIERKVTIKQHPRPISVSPLYVNLVKAPAEKYYVNEPKHTYTAPDYSPKEYSAPSQDSYAAPTSNQDSYGSDSYGSGPAVDSYGAASGSDNLSELSSLPAFASATKDGAQASAGYQLLQDGASLTSY